MTHVLVIAIFLVLFLRDMAERPPIDLHPVSVVLITTAGHLCIALVALLYIRSQVRRLVKGGKTNAIRRAESAASAARFIAVAWHILAVLAIGWLDAIRAMVGDVIAADELLAIAPPLLVMLAGWWSFYPIEAHIRSTMMLRSLDTGEPLYPTPTRARFVLMHARHHLALLVVPISIVLAWNEAVVVAAMRLEPIVPRVEWIGQAVGVVQIAGSLMVLAFVPLVITRIWDTTPLGPGELRDRLVALCRGARAGAREILVWNTGGTMVNGAVLGFIPSLRYILLTDALLESLTDRQAEAVLAHEVAHVRRHHMLWLAATAGAALLGGGALIETGVRRVIGADGLTGTTAPVAQLTVIALAFAFTLLVFGYVSRRFEWQADAFAAAQLSPVSDHGRAVVAPEAAHAMIAALDAVAYLNHIPKDRFTWRHGSIAERQRRLLDLIGRPVDALPIDSSVSLLKVAAIIALSVAVWAVV